MIITFLLVKEAKLSIKSVIRQGRGWTNQEKVNKSVNHMRIIKMNWNGKTCELLGKQKRRGKVSKKWPFVWETIITVNILFNVQFPFVIRLEMMNQQNINCW